MTSGKSNVLIIGAGIGGLATAAQLARHGYEVTVVEKNEKSGGRCGQMVVEGYTFDTGATLFLMPDLYRQAFADLGERMEDYLDLHRIDPTYHLYFPDRTRLQLTSDKHLMRERLEAIEPGSFEQMQRYLLAGQKYYDLSLPNVVQRDFRTFFQFINPRMITIFLRLNALLRHTDYVKRFFKDPRLLMAFTFQDMYMGLSPYDSPTSYSLMQYTELAHGLYYPKGGMYSVAQAFEKIAIKYGVKILHNSSVEKILTNGDRAGGVVLSGGQTLLADIVVANADLGYVYNSLLPDDGVAARINRKEYGCSTVMFYWGLDQQFPQFGPHNLFLCGDYRQGFEDIFKKLSLPDEPDFYIHAPVRLDPSMAPAGKETLVVAVPVGHIDPRKPQDWPAIQARARAFILKRLAELGFPELESHIKTEVSFIPQDWQNRYNLTLGSTHGLSHKLTQMAYFRPHNRHQRYHNLYFVGASTHPGTGVPTVLVSAHLVAERVLQENGG